MKNLIRLEELGLFLLSIVLFSRLTYTWWVYPVLLLAPDLGMIGYVFGPRPGSVTYNLTHHKGLAVAFYVVGVRYAFPVLALVGVIMLGHSSLDRVFGYGLKYGDAFQHTHLGWIGRSKDREISAV